MEGKFESKRAPNRLLLKEKSADSRLKNVGSDPDVWITQLEDLQVQINNAKENSISDDEISERKINCQIYFYSFHIWINKPN